MLLIIDISSCTFNSRSTEISTIESTIHTSHINYSSYFFFSKNEDDLITFINSNLDFNNSSPNYLKLIITKKKKAENDPSLSYAFLISYQDIASIGYEDFYEIIDNVTVYKQSNIFNLIFQKLINDFELHYEISSLKNHYLKVWGESLVYAFWEILKKFNVGEIGLNNDDFRKIEELKQYIITNIYKTPPTIEKMAYMVGMSPTKFKVYFKKYIGASPHQYILTVKLSKAFELLSTGQFSVSQVAYKVGFNHPASFSRFFKQKYSRSPSTIRNH